MLYFDHLNGNFLARLKSGLQSSLDAEKDGRAEHGRFFAVSARSARLEEGVIIRKKKISERYFTGAEEIINANNWVIP